MKIMNKVMLFIFTCLTLCNISTQCFYYSDDPGANVMGNAATGALVGGLAGGGRGAAIGAGVGLGVGAIGAAARSNDRRRYDDGYYRDQRYSRSRRQRQRDIENENAELRARLQRYENYQE
jgi:hypothetical protein